MGFEDFEDYKNMLNENLKGVLHNFSIGLRESIKNLNSQKRVRTSYNIKNDFIMNDGKRFRPILTLIVAEGYGINPAEIATEALSTELVHNSTLVHDDWMDGDEWRRGKKTVHESCKNHYTDQDTPFPNFTNEQSAKALAEATLVGNIVYTEGIRLLSNSENSEAQKALDDLAETYIRINQGQIVDIESIKGGDDEYQQMAYLKTAVLFESAARIGAYLSGQSKEIVKKVGEAITPAARAFQITDDLLDISPRRGAKQGSDIRSGKNNLLISRFYKIASNKQKEWFSNYYGDSNLSQNNLEKAIYLLEGSGTVNHIEKIRDRLYKESTNLIKDLQIPKNESQLLEYAKLLAIRDK